MGYYDRAENVEAYIRMAAGYDGKLLVDILRRRLPSGSTVLELGMGPGKDLLLLNEHFQAVGSDSSAIFVERFRKLHPGAAVQRLDAITLETDRRYAAIYSNKVLPHLSRAELRASFERQAQVVASDGLALHSFWYGDEENEHQGLRFVHYSESALTMLFEPEFDLLESGRYSELERDDSLYILLRKRSARIHAKGQRDRSG